MAEYIAKGDNRFRSLVAVNSNNTAPSIGTFAGQTKLIIHFVYMSKSCTPPPKYKNKIEN